MTSPRRAKNAPVSRLVAESVAARAANAPLPWYVRWRTLGLALGSALGGWLALSPLAWWPLAWLAPAGWLVLIADEKLLGKRPYLAIYLAGVVHWLLVMEGVRTAYWALYFGWLALGLYVGVYVPLFIGLSRVAVHRLRVPLIVAAPLVWMGLELVRAYMFTGFSFGMLAHSQARWTALIQIADWGGAYVVSGVMMFVCACLVAALPRACRTWRWQPLALAACALASVLAYGQFRLAEARALAQRDERAPLRVALLQEAVDTVFGVPAERFAETYDKYQQLAERAAKEHPETQLLVWPESVAMSIYPDFTAAPGVLPAPDASPEAARFHEFFAERQQLFDHHTQEIATAGGRRVPQLVGSLTVAYEADRQEHHYNSALLVSPEGKVTQRYYKQHRVMFGEYIPFGDTFPWIYQLTPMPQGLSRGREPVALDVAGYKLAPSICFESTVPHLIRRQMRTLAAHGNAPDMLVNLTNDGWFWGSGVLDLHRDCAPFRAVEHRRPMLVASNTGFSVALDGSGRFLASGPRRRVAIVTAAVPPDGRSSLYTLWGDVPAGAGLLFVLICAGAGLWRPRPSWE